MLRKFVDWKVDEINSNIFNSEWFSYLHERIRFISFLRWITGLSSCTRYQTHPLALAKYHYNIENRVLYSNIKKLDALWWILILLRSRLKKKYLVLYLIVLFSMGDIDCLQICKGNFISSLCWTIEQLGIISKRRVGEKYIYIIIFLLQEARDGNVPSANHDRHFRAS